LKDETLYKVTYPK